MIHELTYIYFEIQNKDMQAQVMIHELTSIYFDDSGYRRVRTV